MCFIRVILPIRWEQGWQEGQSGKGQHFQMPVWVRCRGRHQPMSVGIHGTGCRWLCVLPVGDFGDDDMQALAECPQGFGGV